MYWQEEKEGSVMREQERLFRLEAENAELKARVRELEYSVRFMRDTIESVRDFANMRGHILSMGTIMDGCNAALRKLNSKGMVE